ncbi:glycosyltransferase family 4 protein [Pseudoalteromonas sp. KAN5]|uniref:glycosyltransferase family 4 protein n=1 Tax=Pseudoalteromonas sp. KAN5 TaxID=2916633 RepID=UPI001FCBE7FF|nr:glycosyltransferase family 4 protein [Pseudoalteromonas sp. KAN5]BDF95579.1 glycosyltransferase family 1 protein [Pseudoalteromonas sp. KAN5]
MKILHILNSDGVGGAEILLRRMIDSSQFESEVMLLWKHNNSQEGFWSGRNFKYITNSFFGLYALLCALFRLPAAIKKSNSDCIQSQLKGADIILGLLFLCRKVKKKGKYIVVIHNSYSFYYGGGVKNKLIGRVHQFLINRYADEIVGVSRQDIDKFENVFGKKYHVIENGIDFKGLVPKKVFSLEKNRLKIACVGNVKLRKGYDRLNKLKETIEKSIILEGVVIELNIAGAIESEHLKLQVESLSGMYFKINFLGKVEDVNSVLREADLFLSLSREEGLPISVLEANALQLPFLISDIPAHRLIVSQEIQNHVLFGDEPELCTLLENIFEDTELRVLIATKQFEQVSQRFDFGIMMKKYQAIYSRVDCV